MVSIVDNVDNKACEEVGDALEGPAGVRDFGRVGRTVAVVAELGSSFS